MDGSRFDNLSRAVVETRSRRGLTRLLAGLVLGGPLALRDLGETAAKKRKKRKKRPSCTPQCSGKQCGPNGCGGVCGSCPFASQTCTAAGQCTCLSSQRTCPTGECVPKSGCCSGNECVNVNGEPGLCEAGTCYYKPRCAMVGVRCTENAWGCCGGCNMATSRCQTSPVGSGCNTTADCNPGLTCVRFTCQAST